MGYIWKPVSKASLHLKQYAVSGSRLYNDAWYGDYGMADFASNLPLDEWMLEIDSWEDDPMYGGKIAGTFSDVRMVQEFKDKDSANAMWKYIRENEPTYAELERLGFRKRP